MVAVRSRVDRLVSPTLSRHLLIALGAAVLLLLLSAQIGAYDDYNLTAVAIYAVAAAGLTLLTGLNGQLSLGHGALMAVGAYTASLLLKDHRQFPVIVVLLLAVLSTGLIGIVFGYAAARLRGPYLAGATLTLAVALPQVATRYKSIFGGDAGLTVRPSAPPDWLGADFPAERWLAWIALAAAVVTMLLLANLLRTAPGRAFKAVRDNEAAAALAGIDVARTQVLAFVISAACAGLAGALLAYWSGITSPAGFSLSLSLQLITAIVIGGLGSLAGAVWGSVVLVYLPLLTSGMATTTLKLPSAVADNLPLAIYGGILVIAMLVAPHGIQGALGRILAFGRARRGLTPGGGQKGVVDWDDPAPGT
jgi:branched-chain amino acid transport system permease protein